MSITKLLIGASSLRTHALEDLGEALTKFGIEYKLVRAEEICTGFPVTKIPMIYRSSAKFDNLLNEFKPDAILTDFPSHFGIATIKAKIPLFVYLRGNIWLEFQWLKETLYRSPQKRFALWWTERNVNRCLNNATMILPVSNYLKNIICEHHPDKKIETLYDGIDPSKWKPDVKLDIKHPSVGLLQDAGVWGKTMEMLTLVKVMQAMPNVTFYWAGDGPYRDYVLPILRKEHNFKWLGRLDYPDKVRQYLTSIDAYALVSGMDTFGHTTLEAQLMEKPVVATNVGGIPETMQENKTGFLVEKGNYNGWIEKLSLLLNDPKKAKQIGNAGRNFVIENFSWEKIASKFAYTLKSQLSE